MRAGNEVPKEYRVIVNEPVDNQGWRMTKAGKGHPKLYAPRGARAMPVPTTPGVQRSLRNFTAQVRRGGAIWPVKR